jgi:(S)-citramalyl-CoA lyase
MAWEPLLYARSRVVHAAASAGIQAIDSPFADLSDLDGLRRAAIQAKSLGMFGKAAKHPSHLSILAEIFSPKPAEVERAQTIVARFDASPSELLVFDGKIIELPTIKRLRQIAAFRDQRGI